MASLLPSFISSGVIKIKINGRTAMFVQNLNINQNVQHVPVGGIGSYGYQANEPVRMNYSGSFSVVGYHKDIAKDLKSQGTDDKTVAPPSIAASSKEDPNNNYKLIRSGHFNPANMIVTSTFDIEVLMREKSTTPILETLKSPGEDDVDVDPITEGVQIVKETTQNPAPLYTLVDCRFTGYSFGYSPGSLLNEQYQFVCNVINYHGPSPLA